MADDFGPPRVAEPRWWMNPVSGYCPMGCGQTLFVGDGGHITCSEDECPNPAAVDELLASPHIDEHIVEVEDAQRGTVSVEHPLHERIGHALLDSCPLNAHFAEHGIGAHDEGRYWVSLVNLGDHKDWVWRSQ